MQRIANSEPHARRGASLLPRITRCPNCRTARMQTGVCVMDANQLCFSEVIVEADERNRAAQDELRADVQDWFDQLAPRQKDALGLWLSGTTDYDACVALAA